MQEALLRLHAAEGVENREAFLTTVTTRLAIDVLRSARVRRETYTGEWLPEPLVEDDGAPAGRGRGGDLARVPRAARAPDARRARRARPARLLRLRRSPRSARSLGKSEDNCRQILSRARRRIGDERPRFDADPEQRHTLAARFLAAAREGDIEGLVAVLAPDAVLVGDGGGKARALPRPLVGAEADRPRASCAFARIAAEWGVTLEPVLVNGQPGVRALAPDGAPRQRRSRSTSPTAPIQRIHSMLNPDKLGHLGPLSDVALRPIGAVSRTHRTPATPNAGRSAAAA